MSKEKIKNILSAKFQNDDHCKLALEQLINEIPFEKMKLLGRISFISLLKRSLKIRQRYKKYIKKSHSQIT